MLDKLSSADFSPHLNQTFRLHAGELTLEIELISVEERGAAYSPNAQRKPFSIIFRGPLEPILPQMIYKIEHSEMGALDLFVVPIGPDERGMRYQAVFS